MSIFSILSSPIVTKQITVTTTVGTSNVLIKTFNETFIIAYVSWISDGSGSTATPNTNAIDTTDADSKGNCIRFYIRKGGSDYNYSVIVGDNNVTHTRSVGLVGYKSALNTAFYCKKGDALYASPLISTFFGTRLMVMYGGWSE